MFLKSIFLSYEESPITLSHTYKLSDKTNIIRKLKKKLRFIQERNQQQRRDEQQQRRFHYKIGQKLRILNSTVDGLFSFPCVTPKQLSDWVSHRRKCLPSKNPETREILHPGPGKIERLVSIFDQNGEGYESPKTRYPS